MNIIIYRLYRKTRVNYIGIILMCAEGNPVNTLCPYCNTAFIDKVGAWCMEALYPPPPDS